MHDARMRACWDPIASLWALLAEINRDAKKRSKPYTEYDIHPYRHQPKEVARPISEMGREWNEASDGQRD